MTRPLAGPLATALLLVLAGVTGCTRTGCSDVGGFDGLSVTIPRALFVNTGSVRVEVCDVGGCARTTTLLEPVPEGPVGQQVNVTFDDLGGDFEPGPVDVVVELSDARGRVVAAADRATTLARSFPNGGSCDGDGYVVGVVELTTDNRTT